MELLYEGFQFMVEIIQWQFDEVFFRKRETQSRVTNNNAMKNCSWRLRFILHHVHSETQYGNTAITSCYGPTMVVHMIEAGLSTNKRMFGKKMYNSMVDKEGTEGEGRLDI